MSGEVKEEIEKKVEEKVEDSANELENIEVKEQDIEELSKEVSTTTTKKLSSHDEIVKKVEATKELAESKYKEYLQAEDELENITKNFIELENKILNTTVADSLELLKRLGVDSLADEEAAISEIQKDNKEQLITIKRPSKGNLKGFFVGLIGTIATIGGALAYGAKMANLPINSATFLQKANLDTIATKYAELINVKGTMPGYALVGVSSLLVGFILYKIVTAIQKSKNSKYVEKIEKDTKQFIENLNNKIAKIYDLGEHIEHIKQVMQKYDIILQEQNAKIRRMLFIEQPEDGVDSLQRASKLEVEKTVLILDELLKLMNTPVNDGIEIREESKERLHSANSVINEVIKKLYV